MTSAQKLWLEQHPEYGPVGQSGAAAAARGGDPSNGEGVLFPNGEFHRWRALGVPGAFLVGPRTQR
jgi:hypothetical protein